MYLLTAIFSKSCLGDILQDLQESNIEGITISDVSGKGNFTFKETQSQPYLNESSHQKSPTTPINTTNKDYL